MLVRMLLVVGRSSPAVAARTDVEEERRLGCRAPGLFVLRFGRALLPHDNYIFFSAMYFCVCAPLRLPSEYRSRLRDTIT